MIGAFLSVESIMKTLRLVALLFRKKPLDIEDLIIMMELPEGKLAEDLRSNFKALDAISGPTPGRIIIATSIIFVLIFHVAFVSLALWLLWIIVRYFI